MNEVLDCRKGAMKPIVFAERAEKIAGRAHKKSPGQTKTPGLVSEGIDQWNPARGRHSTKSYGGSTFPGGGDGKGAYRTVRFGCIIFISAPPRQEAKCEKWSNR